MLASAETGDSMAGQINLIGETVSKTQARNLLNMFFLKMLFGSKSNLHQLPSTHTKYTICRTLKMFIHVHMHESAGIYLVSAMFHNFTIEWSPIFVEAPP